MSKTTKQRKALAKQRNKELDLVKSLDPQFSCQGEIGTFIGLYLQSEVSAKKLQQYYRKDVNKKVGKKDLNITALEAAIKHFKLNVDVNDLPTLFKGGTGKKNKKSARQLRNGYLHTLSPSDRTEILSKAKNLNFKLREFLENRI